MIDKDDGFTIHTARVTVTNVAPTATLIAPATVDEGDVADVSFVGVTDPSPVDGAAGTKYAYDFDDDGPYDLGTLDYATASPLAAVSLPAALTADGDKDVTVKAAVIDNNGGVSTYTKTIAVDNVAPTATITGPEAVLSSGETTLTIGGDHPLAGRPALPARRRSARQDRQDAHHEGALLARHRRLGEVQPPAPLRQGRRVPVPAGPRRQAP